MERYTLPHGARGIDIGDLALRFGGDKAEFFLKSDGGSHHTLHAGFCSGIIDLHEALVDDAGQKQYRTVFAILRDDLPTALSELAPMVSELLSLVRPLRLEWLKRRGIAIARGLDPVTDDEIAAVTRKQRGRLVVDEQRWAASMVVPEYLDGVFDFPDGIFSLVRRDRKFGIGFKNTDPFGNVRLLWISVRDMTRFADVWQPKVIEALVRHSIPRENYGDYPFLQP
jgi:hypothetical protein